MKIARRIASLTLSLTLTAGLMLVQTSAAGTTELDVAWLPNDWTVNTGIDQYCQDGYLIVKKLMPSGYGWDTGEGLYGIADSAGNLTVDFRYPSLEGISCGRVLTQKDDKYGFIDLQGNQALPFIYDNVSPFNDLGYAWTRDSGFRNERYIDVNGNEISVMDYMLDVKKEDYYTQIYEHGTYLAPERRVWVWDANKNLLTDSIPTDGYYDAVVYDGERVVTERNGKLGMVTLENRTIGEFQYDVVELASFGNTRYLGVCAVGDYILVGRDDDQDGVAVMGLSEYYDSVSLVDKNWNLVFPFGTYDYIDNIGNGFIEVKNEKNQKWGILDQSLNEVLPCGYDYISFDEEENIYKTTIEATSDGGPRMNQIWDANLKLIAEYPDGNEKYSSISYLGEGVFCGRRNIPTGFNPYTIDSFEAVLWDSNGRQLGVMQNVTVTDFHDGYAVVFTRDEKSYMEKNPIPTALRDYYYDRYGILKNPLQVAYSSTQTVNVDGKPVEFQMYALKDTKGNLTNYVKLRDAAYVLNGTKAQFSVEWDGSIDLKPGASYTVTNTEMQTPFSGNRSYKVCNAETKVDGTAVGFDAITLTDDKGNDYNYYKLRDLGEALGFNVGWNNESKTVFVETDRAYQVP